MYKVLIVEDEKEIANGIKNSLPWAQWGTRSAECVVMERRHWR